MKVKAPQTAKKKEELPVLPADSLPAPSLSKRAFVGGVLYIEGLITAFFGMVFLFSYWPPISVGDTKANPISQVGMFITVAAVSYLIIACTFMFFYNLLRPHRPEIPTEETSLQYRARRYAATKEHLQPYLFDAAIRNEEEADEAYLARKTLW